MVHGAIFRKSFIPGQGSLHVGSRSLAACEFSALKEHIDCTVKLGIFLRELEIGFGEFGRYCLKGVRRSG